MASSPSVADVLPSSPEPRERAPLLSGGQREMLKLLKRAGLEKLQPTLAAHEVDDLDAAKLLRDTDWQQMGVAIGSRRKLMAALGTLSDEPEGIERYTTGPEGVPPRRTQGVAHGDAQSDAQADAQLLTMQPLATALAAPQAPSAPLVPTASSDAPSRALCMQKSGAAQSSPRSTDGGDFVFVEAPSAAAINDGNGKTIAEDSFFRVDARTGSADWEDDSSDADDSAKEKARLVERASQSGQGVRKSRGAGFMASVKSRHYEKFDFN